MKENKNTRLKEWLISLIITLVMLGLVMGAQYWYTGMTGILFDTKWVWIGNLVGGVIMIFIVHHFVKRPKDDQG